ncbi:MarR family transcriptional regulator [Azospirillum sp. TSO35-2]|uniref:MarR family transcriptional regulator n=1 Tax=Azospirillum sp. TSO35-2 TaxID=716796 RepID=UPI000D619591|nr:MarR family transcriptional regulator [Azospirillum sp. TSO35-2]PWC36504.1 hypothetical protein TSO352_15645 [Azospirillum sp. TSO35-2]
MKPYIDMYRHWIAIPGIQAADIAVLSALYAHADRDGVCTATQGELAEELGQSRAWFNAVLKGLQEPPAALVCAQPRRGLRGFAYRLAGSVGGTFCQPADTGGPPAGFSLDSGNPESSSSHPDEGRADGASDGALPTDWQPDADDLAWAARERPDVDPARVTAKFVAWCRKAHRRNGYRPADPGAAWRRWIGRELVTPPPEPADRSVASPAAPPISAPQFRREPRHAAHPDRRAGRSDAQRQSTRSGGASSGSDAGNRNRDTLAALRLRLAGPA